MIATIALWIGVAISIIVVANSVRWFWTQIGIQAEELRQPRNPQERKPHESVYLTRKEIERVHTSMHDMAHSRGSVQWSADLVHPDWSRTQLRTAVAKSIAVFRAPDGVMSVIDRVGILLHPSGESELDHGDLVHPAKDAALERHRILTTSPSQHVYLFRTDVRSLFHHNFYIAINHGYHRRHVHHKYPGWSWEALFEPLRTTVPYLDHRLREKHGYSAIDGPPGEVIGVLIDRNGTVIVDDGSLEHPAKTFAQQRRPQTDPTEQCNLISNNHHSPVIVHVPHASRLIPARVREDLFVTETELADELDLMTDAGVGAVVDTMLDAPIGTTRPSIVAATMSRLVFDPERFESNDPMEAVGMGVVYMKRADGSVLRNELSLERREWYLEQYRAYTASLEQVVANTVSGAGSAVIIDLHSYPKEPLGYEPAGRHRPEICVGVDSDHTPPWLVDATIAAFSEYDVEINTPFEGSYVPGRWYRSDRPIYSIMVEVRRDVLTSKRGVDQVAAAIHTLIKGIER